MRNKKKVLNGNSKEKSEVTAIGKALRMLGGAGGNALGGMVGLSKAGGQAGTSLGGAISKWLGFGDYVVRMNSVVNRASTGVPMMHKDGQTVTIRHREYIAQIKGSQTFTVQGSYVLNPGQRATFPWLSTIANSFQEYRFKGVVFHYIPSSGNAVSSTNAALGTVMLQTSYRSNDTPPTTKAELLNEYWSGESVPSDTFAHPIECDPNENPFNVQYISSDDVPSSDSVLLYDLGVTHVCSSGQQIDGSTLGDLWVTYEVELKKPIVASNVTSNYQVVSASATPTAQNRLFPSIQFDRGNVTVVGSTTANAFTFAAGLRGNYLMNVIFEASSTFTHSTGILSISNTATTPIGPVIGDTNSYGSLGTSATSNCMLVNSFRVLDPSLPVVVTMSGASSFSVLPAKSIITLTQFN